LKWRIASSEYPASSGRWSPHRLLLERHRDALAAAALDEYLADGTLQRRLPLMLDAWFAYVEGHPYAWRLLFRDTTGDLEIQELVLTPILGA
jgi:hypothetical protein